MSAGARLVVVGVVVLIAAASLTYWTAWLRAGEATTLTPIFEGTCEAWTGYVGAEDMVRDSATGRVYVSGEDRRALRRGDSVRGAIWSVGIDSPGERVDLTGGAPTDFHPLGIDLHVGADGVNRLFVVNRASIGHRVEVYRVKSDGSLDLERTFSGDLLENANDVAAAGPAAAYVSIDKASPTGSFGEVLEGVFDRPNGMIVRVDADGATVVADNLKYANGLALSEDGATLYAAETLGKRLNFYDIGEDGGLSIRDRVRLGTGLDNITRDDAGRLFIAAHPKLLTFALGHAKSANKDSPSQVVVVDPANEVVDQVFLSLGADISGSSVALVDVAARRMLVGSVYEPHILACDLPEVWRHSESHPARRPVAAGDE